MPSAQFTRILLGFAFLLVVHSLPAQQPKPPADGRALFERGMNALVGTGVSRNELNGVDYIRRAAERGYPPAQTVMGYFVDTGTIVAAEPALAAEWYRKAAQQDDRLGEWLLGRIYYAGVAVPRDLTKAELWLRKAADQEDPFGQYLLGQIQLERNHYAQAADLFRKAAMQGLPQAQQQLGLLLKEGRGEVAEDKFQAYVWLLLSFQAGNQSVANDLQVLEAALGSTRVEEAKTHARDLEESTARTVAAHGCTGWAGEFSTIPAPPPPQVQKFCR